MGLDIYLYKYQDFEKTQKAENEYEEFSEKLWEGLDYESMIPGKSTLLRERDCIYVVTESDNSWYEQALVIIKATCEHVLAQDDKEKYYLHWSG